MKINREGTETIVLTGAVCSLLYALTMRFAGHLLPLWVLVALAAVLVAGWAVIVAFFREPPRSAACEPGVIYAPCDGRVVVCEPVEENEYLHGTYLQVSVFMSLTDVHVNWYPASGRVAYYCYHPGKFMVAWHPKSSVDNERTTTVVDTGHGPILFRQIAGLVARRIVSYARVGDEVCSADKCGFIKFGSRCDVMLPLDAEILVGIGQKVAGSRTPIARLK